MKGILGRKLGMTQVFTEEGNLVPVTVIECNPNVVLQKKTVETDGYEALQLGLEDVKDKTISIKGRERFTHITPEKEYTLVTEKGKEVNFELNYNLPSSLISVEAGQIVGNVEIVVDGVVVETINLLATETHKEATLWDYFKEITKA